MSSSTSSTRQGRVTAERLTVLANHLTDRDREVALALYEHRILTSSQLTLLFFSGRRRAMDRLLLLYRARVLDRFYPPRPFAQGKPQAHWLLDEAGAHIPYGYRRNEAKELVAEEREAPIVRRIFDLYTAGRHGAVSIARLLDAEQAPARNGQGWQPAVVLLILRNEAYVGRVHWRGQSFEGKHAGLVDEATFERAQALLKERGEDCAQRVGQRSDFLLSGLLRCGRCRRAYVGMSARGNGGQYHYYACSGRQKRGPRACDGDRIPREKLEDVVIEQLADIYRDGHLIRTAIEQAAEGEQGERTVLEDRRASVAAEIRRAERAIDRYLDAFENGDLDPKRFDTRLSALHAKLDGLKDQDQQLAHELDAEAPHAPDTAELHATANALEDAIRQGNPEHTKALLRILIQELRVNSRAEILPTYRIATPTVCATTTSVELAGLEPATFALPARRSPN
jgi:site-specific DNA recombinase